MIDYIDRYKARFGVEPICRVLRDADVQIAPSTYYAAKTRPPSARALRDERLKAEILRVYRANRGVYGARKVWQARCGRRCAATAWRSPNAPWNG